MDLVGRILFGRLQIDKRAEHPWYLTGNETIDAVLKLIPVITACGIAMGIINSLPITGLRRNPVKLFIIKLRMKLYGLFYKPRMAIMKLDRYLFGEPLRRSVK